MSETIKHGDARRNNRTRLHRIWTQMKSRCQNSNNTNYCNYGGIGISVCAEWNEYINFRNWAALSGYSDLLEIDREDPYSGYNPDNCRWVDKFVQNSNKRKKSGTSSIYIGVSFHKASGQYRAMVDSKGISNYVGIFKKEKDAAVARDLYIVKNDLPHRLNFIGDL